MLSWYPRGSAMVWLTAAAVGPLALALHAPLALVVLAFVVVGGVQPVHDVLLSRTLRGSLPREALGPATAVEELGSLAALPAGQVLGGLVIDRFGPAPAAWLIVCVLAVALLPIPRTQPGRAGIRSGSPASAGLR
jgi:predicted MFS family arabinose efflux permease